MTNDDLGNIEALSQLSESERSGLFDHGETLEVADGELIVRRGDEGDTMYVIDAGEVDLEFEAGKPSKRLGPGGFFGEVSLFTSASERTATAIAHGPARLRVIDHTAVVSLKEVDPRLLCSLLQKTCQYLVDSEQSLIGQLRRKNRELEGALADLRRSRER